jgi:hypothetical protein
MGSETKLHKEKAVKDATITTTIVHKNEFEFNWEFN